LLGVTGRLHGAMMPPRDASSELLPAVRQARILELVRQEGATSIQRLGQAIGVSLSTIRRDLDFLTERGYLERTHGGALLNARLRTTFEPASNIAAEVALAEKQAIGAYAATLAEEGQSVILDSSSTVHEAARAIARRTIPLTAVTNDLGIASTLGTVAGIDVIVLGGRLRRDSLTLLGEPGHGFIQGLQADLALIGAHSLAQQRASDSSIEVAMMKRALIGGARRVVLLADSSKFEHPSFCEICPVKRLHEIVTDSGIPPGERKALLRLGVKVTVVEVAKPVAARGGAR
jgi:DeoR family transcriptional regulator of aga operon